MGETLEINGTLAILGLKTLDTRSFELDLVEKKDTIHGLEWTVVGMIAYWQTDRNVYSIPRATKRETSAYQTDTFLETRHN